jgi:2OG-Fe(II) oxygenase superfamily
VPYTGQRITQEPLLTDVTDEVEQILRENMHSATFPRAVAMSTIDPRSVIRNRQWWKRAAPFPHFIGRDVFVTDFQRGLEEAFGAVLSQERDKAFTRSARGYDAYIYPYPPTIDGPLSFFISRGWRDLLASMVGVEVTDDVSAALHHHEPRSKHGVVHNDLNPGWFVDRPRADGINSASSTWCDYHHGEPHEPGATPVCRVRAIAMLYFLNNGPWKAGQGGECALYADRDAPEPGVKIAPIDNSILVFECTPWSFHRFLSNGASTRDSIILWLHRDRRHALDRWGERAIVKWSQRT